MGVDRHLVLLQTWFRSATPGLMSPSDAEMEFWQKWPTSKWRWMVTTSPRKWRRAVFPTAGLQRAWKSRCAGLSSCRNSRTGTGATGVPREHTVPAMPQSAAASASDSTYESLSFSFPWRSAVFHLPQRRPDFRRGDRQQCLGSWESVGEFVTRKALMHETCLLPFVARLFMCSISR